MVQVPQNPSSRVYLHFQAPTLSHPQAIKQYCLSSSLAGGDPHFHLVTKPSVEGLVSPSDSSLGEPSDSSLANYWTFWLEESHTLSGHPSLPNYQTTKLSDVKSLSNHHHGILYHASDLVSSTYPTLLNYHSGWRGPTPHLVIPPSLTIKLPSSLTSKDY